MINILDKILNKTKVFTLDYMVVTFLEKLVCIKNLLIYIYRMEFNSRSRLTKISVQSDDIFKSCMGYRKFHCAGCLAYCRLFSNTDPAHNMSGSTSIMIILNALHKLSNHPLRIILPPLSTNTLVLSKE